jgi:hypothetical protein
MWMEILNVVCIEIAVLRHAKPRSLVDIYKGVVNTCGS